VVGAYSNQSGSSTILIVVIVAISASLLVANFMFSQPFIPPPPSGNGTLTTTPTTTVPSPPENLTAHEPIYIDGNPDFHLQAEENDWPGDGSAENPYVIQGYSIEGSEMCINIMYTSLHFEIRNCSFSCPNPAPFGGMGVNIWEADYGLVEYCTFRDMEWGVNLFKTSKCDVKWCDIEAAWIGVNVSYSGGGWVEGNTIRGASYAVFVDNSGDFFVLENNLCSNECGVAVWESYGGGVHYNNISFTNWVAYNAGVGIILESGTSSIMLLNNQIGWNDGGNALDDGSGNSWDDGEIGNAWSDYSGSGVYPIPGSAESVDNFPSIFL
jgi:hypothetical protein